MPMTFLEPTRFTMIVMDGDRCVARARRWGIGWWLLEAVDACWTDPRARQPLRDDFPAGYKDMFSKNPRLLAFKAKGDARATMRGLADTGRPTKVSTAK